MHLERQRDDLAGGCFDDVDFPEEPRALERGPSVKGVLGVSSLLPEELGPREDDDPIAELHDQRILRMDLHEEAPLVGLGERDDDGEVGRAQNE